jgi:hypothetical protein
VGVPVRRVLPVAAACPATSAQVDAITQVLIGDGTSETSAVEFARAQLELLRIRAIRAELMNEADLKLEKALGTSHPLESPYPDYCFGTTNRERNSSI